MATGFPSITTPRALELRTIQQIIDNIRQRFVADEAEIVRLAGLASSSTTIQALQALQQQATQLAQTISALANAQAAGGTTDSTLGRRQPEPIRLRGPGMVSATIEAGGYSLDLDLVQAAVFVKSVAPRPPPPPRPDDSQFVIANRIFGG